MRNDSSILVRHVIAEIAKVLVLTTTVMVIVVAFGAVIRPLAQNLLGPFGVAKYVALATVPMLQFALPFAGGFAATLVTHRMVSDNEFLAMSVSGLSYRSIFRPHVVLSAFMHSALTMLHWKLTVMCAEGNRYRQESQNEAARFAPSSQAHRLLASRGTGRKNVVVMARAAAKVAPVKVR